MQTSTPPIRRHSRVAKCYSTLIANLLKISSRSFSLRCPSFGRMLVPMDRKLGPRLAFP